MQELESIIARALRVAEFFDFGEETEASACTFAAKTTLAHSIGRYAVPSDRAVVGLASELVEREVDAGVTAGLGKGSDAP
jgi:hypothetical protein